MAGYILTNLSQNCNCLQTNRNFIGIEKVEKYYDIAKQRINEAKAQRRLI